MFKGISEYGSGGAIFLNKVPIEFSLTNSVLTNCTCQGGSGGGGVYCRSKVQVISNSCFHLCISPSGDGHAARLYLADKDSTEAREIVRSSFVSCPITPDINDLIESQNGVDHTEDTNTSACKVSNALYHVYNYKGFFTKRCTLSNVLSNFQVYFSAETIYSFERCNMCNNSRYFDSSAFFANFFPVTCEECIFIQNTFKSLSMSGGVLETINCQFYANDFSQGSYATSLPLHYRATAMCVNGKGSWRFSPSTHEAFSLWKALKLLIGIHILLL